LSECKEASLVSETNAAVWETIAHQLAKCECKMILASISIQVLAILASWHVCAKYDNLRKLFHNIKFNIIQ
jgi:hypothetical protein